MIYIGQLNANIDFLLDLPPRKDRSIYIGMSNIRHIINRHPEDYRKYGKDIANIIADPDFVGENPKDHSIEFIKEFKINDEYVKVAVRVSSSDRLYVRSLYVVNKTRVENFIKRGTLKRMK